MKERSDKNSDIEEAGEAQLHELIKQAGNEVRSQNKKALADHLKRLQAAVDEGMAHWKNPQTT